MLSVTSFYRAILFASDSFRSQEESYSGASNVALSRLSLKSRAELSEVSRCIQLLASGSLTGLKRKFHERDDSGCKVPPSLRESNMMNMETAEDFQKRFERKRKLKETLCRNGLIAHKVRLGNSIQFAFALATPNGAPIAQPCSSEDLNECCHWLSITNPTHSFFQERTRPLEPQGPKLATDSRYLPTEYTASYLNSYPASHPAFRIGALRGELPNHPGTTLIHEQGVPNYRQQENVYPSCRPGFGVEGVPNYGQQVTSFPATQPGFNVGSIREELPTHDPLATLFHEQGVPTYGQQELRRPDQGDERQHQERLASGNVAPPCTGRDQRASLPTPDHGLPDHNLPDVNPSNDPRGSRDPERQRERNDKHFCRRAHTNEPHKSSREGGRDKVSGRGEHRQSNERYKATKDGDWDRGEHRHRGMRRERPSDDRCDRKLRGYKDEARVLTSKSDEGSGTGGQDGHAREEKNRDRKDRPERVKFESRKIDPVLLESDAESKPQELSTPSRTISRHVKRTMSSDFSLSPEISQKKYADNPKSYTAGLHSRYENRHRSGDPHNRQKDVNPSILDGRRSTVKFSHEGKKRTRTKEERKNDGPMSDHHKKASKDSGINNGENTLSWKPSPLYQAASAPAPEKSESSFDSVCTDAEQDNDEEACEREERAVTRYTRLFTDDKSWKEGFEATRMLTCDVCKMGGKVKRVPDVKALVSHARTMKRMKMAEHRGYARAICELMQISFDGLEQIAKPWEGTPGKPTLEKIVWPPIVVLENTRTVKGPDGLWKGVEADELNEVLEVSLGRKCTNSFKPIFGKNGHKGRVLVEFPPSHQAWVDATTLHKQFKMNARGYTEWLAVKPRWHHHVPDNIKESTDFVRLDDAGNSKRVLYGYLAEPRHMEVFDPTRKYVRNWKVEKKSIL